MSANIKYLPVYLGLYASQVFAIVCNIFLDIEYGMFGTEVIIWMLLLGFTVTCGYRFQGNSAEYGKKVMKYFLWFSLIVTVLIIIPMWSFPRAGIYILALIMAAYNCVTTTHKHLNVSLLISLIMVMFATSHYRADWTMMFYLLPYLISVVFTLIAAQVYQKMDSVQQLSIQKRAYRGQFFATIGATFLIILVGIFLYIATPQVNANYFVWKWGLPSVIKLGKGEHRVILDTSKDGGESGQFESSKPNGQSSSKDGDESGQYEGPKPNGQSSFKGSEEGNSAGQIYNNKWPTIAEMREASSRDGIPKWQSATIRAMATVIEQISAVEKVASISEQCLKLAQKIKEDTKDNIDEAKEIIFELYDINKLNLLLLFMLLIFLILLIALFKIIKELQVVTWIRTRYDYIKFILLNIQPENEVVAIKYYEAMIRLFELKEIKRSMNKNTQEYLIELKVYRYLNQETALITHLLEDRLYGNKNINKAELTNIKSAYKRIYKNLL